VCIDAHHDTVGNRMTTEPGGGNRAFERADGTMEVMP
jgi:hypothetical protein